MKRKRRTAKASGRPKGAGNKERLDVVVYPTACPNQNCKSTRLIKEKKVDVDDLVLSGVIDGHRYNRIVYHHGYCKDCGQQIRMRSHVNDNSLAVSKESADDADMVQ